MTTAQQITEIAPSKGKVWTARIMGGLVIAFMLFDGIFKLIPNEMVIEGTVELGFQAHHLVTIGSLALVSTVLYIIPRTEILGAVLLTGYWGGAIATNVRMDNPLFSHVLFPVYLALLAWGAIWMRSETLRQLFPIKNKS